MDLPSASRANKAGDRLRHLYSDPGAGLTGYEWDAERAVLGAWRKQFQAPLASTDMSLRSAVATVTDISNGVGMVKQRFKREQQIIAKLVRDRTRLSKMEDIGGCRAVLPDLATVDAVADRLQHFAISLEIESMDDYIHEPRRGGYRAVHLHCIRDGCRIEVQLRTTRQHSWAEAVESWDGASGQDIKHERGPSEVIEAFRLSAEMLASEDLHLDEPVWSSLTKMHARGMLQRWIQDQGTGRHPR